MVTTGFKPSSTSPVHLCRLYDVGNSELGLYKSNKSNLHLTHPFDTLVSGLGETVPGCLKWR